MLLWDLYNPLRNTTLSGRFKNMSAQLKWPRASGCGFIRARDSRLWFRDYGLGFRV